MGWTVDEMRDHPDILSEFYPDPAVREAAIAFMALSDAGWKDFKINVRDKIMLDTTWANVHIDSGNTLGIGQVITHRIELENQRIYAHELRAELQKERELRELKERFVSLISHEFRTPLAVMNISIEFIFHYMDTLSAVRLLEKLTVVHQQIQRMIDLMEDTLRFSQSSAGKVEFLSVPIEILPFCQNIIDTIKLTDDSGHKIVLEGDAGIVHADHKLLAHVLSNLLSNAVKYSPEDTEITLHVGRHADHWKFSVQDAGIGIPEDDLPKLFDPFQRASNAYELPGTGLGLSIVKEYVELHGGKVSVKSTLGVRHNICF